MILADRVCGFLYLVNAMKFMSMSAEDAAAFQEKVLVVLECDFLTGLFRWKKRITGRCKEGWFGGTKYPNGYTEICVLWNRLYGHQLAWLMYYGSIPTHQIDHENRNRSDNRISNLRDIPHIENMRNIKMPNTNTSGHIGVCFDKKTNKWQAQIKVNKRNIFLGRFDRKEEAVIIREAAELQYGFHPNHGKKI